MSGSNRVAAGIFTSRVVGLAREILIGGVLGRSATADAFRLAMRVPNLLQNLLGEGAISASFVPVFAELVEDEKDDEAKDLAGAIFGYLAVLVVVLVAIVVLAARPLVWLTTLGAVNGVRFDWAVQLTRITAAGAGLLVLASICLGILNAHRNYFLPYAAPVLWSGAQILAILGALIFVDRTDAEGFVTTEFFAAAQWLAVAAVIGSALQFGVQWPTVRRLVSGLTPHLRRDENVSRVFQRFVPALTGRGVLQLSSFLDIALASLLVVGAVATLGMVTPLYLICIGVFGFSVATAELTEMSRLQKNPALVARRVRLGIRKVLLPAGLATALFLFASPQIIDALYGWLNRVLDLASFGPGDVSVAAATLSAFALGLPAAMQARITQNALFALGDVAGPARIALVRLGVMAVAGFLLMIQFDHLAYDPGAVVIEDGTSVQYRDLANEIVDDGGEPVFGTLDDGPFNTVAVNGFPHSRFWEPQGTLIREESLFSHYGTVGLGLASALAAWTEFFLLRRRLSGAVAQTLASRIGWSVAAAGSVAGLLALIYRLYFPDLPGPLDAMLIGPLALGAYIGTLRLLGYKPRSRSQTSDEPTVTLNKAT